MTDAELERDLREAAGTSRGHFRHESGHHGDLWLELDLLLVFVVFPGSGTGRPLPQAELARRGAALLAACGGRPARP